VNVDADIKRYFPFIVLLAIAVIAYFQVNACGNLISARLANPPELPPLPSVTVELDDGKPILERNAFDSNTGPLDASAPPSEDAGPASCAEGRVVSITKTEDPAWSFATIEDRAGHSQLRRVGDTHDGFRLEAVEWDRVILSSGDQRCQLVMGEAGASPVGEREKPRTPAALLLELADSMKKVGDHELHIPRPLVKQLLKAEEELTAEAQLKPAKQGDKITGVRLEGVRKGTLFDWLLLKNGDVLESVNGQSLAEPEKAPDIYALLGTADQLTLRLSRKGVPVTITYVIE
jgi:general secretion pathway protein C